MTGALINMQRCHYHSDRQHSAFPFSNLGMPNLNVFFRLKGPSACFYTLFSNNTHSTFKKIIVMSFIGGVGPRDIQYPDSKKDIVCKIPVGKGAKRRDGWMQTAELVSRFNNRIDVRVFPVYKNLSPPQL